MAYHFVFIWVILRVLKLFYPELPVFFSQIVFVSLIVYSFLITKVFKKLFKILDVKFLLLFSLIVYSFISLLAQIIFFDIIVDFKNTSTFSMVLDTSLNIFIWTLIGSALAESHISKKYTISYIVLLIGIFVVNVKDGFFVDYSELINKRGGGEEISHLFAGEPIMMALIITFCSLKGKSILFNIFSIVLLFSLGGRTALICYCLTMVVYFLCIKSLDFFKNIFLVLFVFTCSFYFYFDEGFLSNPIFQRMLFFRDEFGSDASISERIEIFKGFSSNIDKYFLIGNLNQIVSDGGRFGAYVHNILSAYQFFGFFGLVLVVFAILFAVFKAFHLIKNEGDNGLCLFFIIFSLFSLLTGRHIGMNIFWLSIGYVFSFEKSIKYFPIRKVNEKNSD